jgi:hypothetical protein
VTQTEGDSLELEVMRLLRVVRPLGDGPVRAAPVSADDTLRFERKYDLDLPAELKAWLRRCDGAAVNPGGIYPLFSRSSEEVSIDWYLTSYPEWRARGWLPVASDGCGDVYVLATSLGAPHGTHPVFFLDQADWETPAYLVASGLWRFLFLLLKSEVLHANGERVYWPFDREAVLAEDPDLASCRGIPLPWDVAEGP